MKEKIKITGLKKVCTLDTLTNFQIGKLVPQSYKEECNVYAALAQFHTSVVASNLLCQCKFGMSIFAKFQIK